MGTSNDEVIIMTTRTPEVINDIKSWVENQEAKFRFLFVYSIGTYDNVETLIFCPNGSKKGWPEDEHYIAFRLQLITKLESYAYDDMSSPVNWVEVGFGEYGQKVLKGNCKNVFSDKLYQTEV